MAFAVPMLKFLRNNSKFRIQNLIANFLLTLDFNMIAHYRLITALSEVINKQNLKD